MTREEEMLQDIDAYRTTIATLRKQILSEVKGKSVEELWREQDYKEMIETLEGELQEQRDIIDGQNRALAALGRENKEITKDRDSWKDSAHRNANAYQALQSATDNCGSINAWNQVWEWFLKFKPIQKMHTRVVEDMDGQIGAASAMIATFEEYFNRYVDYEEEKE